MKRLLFAGLLFISYASYGQFTSRVAAAQAYNDSVYNLPLGVYVEPINTQTVGDTIYNLILTLNGLISATSGLPAVLAANPTAATPLMIVDACGQESFMTGEGFAQKGFTTDPYYSAYIGMDAPCTGNGEVVLRDNSSGFFSVDKAGPLTGTRGFLHPDEPLANGVGLPSTYVMHWTDNPVFVYGGGDTSQISEGFIASYDGGGNSTVLRPGNFSSAFANPSLAGNNWSLFGTANILNWNYLSPIGTTNFFGRLHGYNGTPTGITLLDWYMPATSGTLAIAGGGYVVDTIKCPDSSLTINPPYGTVLEKINVHHFNVWDSAEISTWLYLKNGAYITNLGSGGSGVRIGQIGEKIGFFGLTTPIVQPSSIDLATGMANLGLCLGCTYPVTLTDSVTLTNKRINSRYGSATSSATPTINTDVFDVYELTAQNANITSFTTNLSGTPVVDNVLHIIVTATGPFTVAFGSAFEASAIPLPTNIVTGRQDWYFVRNTTTSKWRIGGVW